MRTKQENKVIEQPNSHLTITAYIDNKNNNNENKI